MSDYPHPLPEVEETSRTSGPKDREVRLRNAYQTHYGNIDWFDREKWETWNADRTDENKADLPYEITYDDCRRDLNLNEAETRHLAAELAKIVAKWDEQDARRKV